MLPSLPSLRALSLQESVLGGPGRRPGIPPCPGPGKRLTAPASQQSPQARFLLASLYALSLCDCPGGGAKVPKKGLVGSGLPSTGPEPPLGSVAVTAHRPPTAMGPQAPRQGRPGRSCLLQGPRAPSGWALSHSLYPSPRPACAGNRRQKARQGVTRSVYFLCWDFS